MSEAAVLVLVAIIIAAAVAITVRVRLNIRSKNSSRKTVQKDNVVGGDQAGGDIRKGP